MTKLLLKKISLVEKGKRFWNETKVVEIFSNSVNKLGINRDDAKFIDDPVLSTNPDGKAIQKFDNQPSVKLIRDN